MENETAAREATPEERLLNRLVNYHSNMEEGTYASGVKIVIDNIKALGFEQGLRASGDLAERQYNVLQQLQNPVAAKEVVLFSSGVVFAFDWFKKDTFK